MVSRAPPAGDARDGFKFRSGHAALDLPATLAFRLRDQPRELLAAPSDLDRWLVAAGLAATRPAATAADLRGARELREALYRLALARARGKGLAPRDRSLLNRWAAQPVPAPQLETSGVRWSSDGVRPLLAAIAREGVALLGGAARIRQCEGRGCAMLFVDASRTGRRRWCSMARCGNKAKVAAFRRRQGRSR